MPTKRPFKRGDILEIVHAEPWWPGHADWMGRLVIVSKAEKDEYAFRWILGAPHQWHNKEMFSLDATDLKVRTIFKKVGRAKL